MFKALRQRWRDMGTIKVLCLEAERVAHAQGHPEPGAEHFVMSALALPDGTARKAFSRLHANPDDFRAAVVRQYEEALRHVGVDIPHGASWDRGDTPLPAGKKTYQVQASAQALMQTMIHDIKVHEQKDHPAAPLLGAHVLWAATRGQYSVAARALRAMGIDATRLAEAAQAEIAAYQMN